jgi:hypothetical protein
MTAVSNFMKNSQAVKNIAKAMGTAKDFVTGLPGKAKQGLINIGNKIKDSKFGQTVANSKFGQAVGTFKTNLKTGYQEALAKNTAKAATKAADVAKDVGTGAVQTGGAAGAGGAVDAATKAEKARKSSVLQGIAGIATAGVMAYQVHSANKQYKDSAKRTDAYNAALKAEEDAATAAQNQATAASNARYDSYVAALNQSSISDTHIFSSGYAGDSVFSSTLKNPRYTLF